MIIIPEINKKNYLKVIRELDISQFPSFDQDIYLKNIRQKLLQKEKLTFTEEQISFHRFKAYLEEYRKEINRYYVQQLDFSPFYKRPPLEFQKDGVKFLLLNDRCILSDDMGLGKSIQSIIASLCLDQTFKILVITLKVLKYNFKNEISFFSDSYTIIEKKWQTGYKFTIINYDSLKKWKKQIIEENFDCIISDEAHVLINNKSKRTKSFQEIIDESEVKKVWLLTGTPITNKPYDYYNLLKIIKHPITKNWVHYIEQYCNGHKNYFGQWITDGHSNEEELYEKTKDKILRRLKKDFVKELPNKDRQPVFLHLENIKGYEKVIKDYEQKKTIELIEDIGELLGSYEETIEATAMTKLLLWRQFCALEKLKDSSLFDLINDHIEQENKIVVFTNFTAVVDAVFNHFGENICRRLDGRIKAENRVPIVEEFNTTASLKILVCNLQVGGVGLNIPSANIAIINDMYWVPGVMLQAEDRLWRIGQERDVTILYPIYQNSVEAIVYEIINNKMKVISTIIEGKKESYFESLKDIKENNKQDILKEIFSQLL